MKTVIFVRHGKSSWEYRVSDQDRPLQERGINDAHLVSAEFKISKELELMQHIPAPQTGPSYLYDILKDF